MITSRTQQAFGRSSGAGYCDCWLCHHGHDGKCDGAEFRPGVPIRAMRELLVDGRVLETYVHTPMVVCPSCAAKWECSDDVSGLAHALRECDDNKRAWTRKREAEFPNPRACPPLSQQAAECWRREVVEGVRIPILLPSGNYK